MHHSRGENNGGSQFDAYPGVLCFLDGFHGDGKRNDGPISHFKANGFSPAWNAEIDGDTIRFEVPETVTPDSKPRIAKVIRQAYAKGANFDGKDGKTRFSLDIKGTECKKTGDRREFTATFQYGKRTYRGCADAVK